MIYGAILAGGIGKRVEGYTIPKQFISVGGTPIIVLTLRTFLNNSRFERIFIAVNRDWNQYLVDLLKHSFSKDELENVTIINGGKERLDSFINVMNVIIDQNGINTEDILICHDAVRPFVSQQMINDCIDATLEDKLALTVIPTVDTIHIAHNKKYIDGTLDREGLYNGQNPSGFNVQILLNAIEKFSDEEKKKITGTTQLMLKLGYKLRMVNGHTSNFKITTDNDIDVADRMIRAQAKTRKIELLDCTLRDGGIVLDFAFGNEQMQKIKSTLENSGIEYIECGYIDEKKGTSSERSCFDNEISIEKNLLKSVKKANVNYVAMIDYGTFDINQLHRRTESGIDGIRLAFHKENWQEAIEAAKVILEKEFDLYMQPMVSMRYSDEEYRELIHVSNVELPQMKGFYIVDSFGQMDNITLLHFIEMADQYVNKATKIGFHAHNNRQMAYSNALTFINYNAKHDVMLDSSIMGIGKGAGNLCTELIELDLIREGKPYNSTAIYDSISDFFSKQQKITPWGYSLDYYLASLYSCTPSYIKIFKYDYRVTTDILVELIKTIPEEKRAACDRNFAAEHLKNFFENR